MIALATDPWQSAETIERRTLAMARAVREAAGVPVAVKLSPFYTSLAHFARQLDQEGADGLVLFNRFYQPDLDVESLDVLAGGGTPIRRPAHPCSKTG